MIAECAARFELNADGTSGVMSASEPATEAEASKFGTSGAEAQSINEYLSEVAADPHYETKALTH